MAPRDHRLGLEADGSLQRLDDGRLLIGGWPRRVVRLTASGARLLDGWLSGGPVGEAPGDRALARRLLDAAIVHPRPGSGPPVSLEDVTVVVPVLDDPAGLVELLAVLGGSAPAVVVDDASRDAGAIADAAARFGARLVVRPVNGGPGVARNTGLAEVATPVVVFVDADAAIDPAAVRTMLGHFADPAVAAVAPRVRSRPGIGLLAAYEAVHSPLDMGEAPSPVGPDRRVRYVPGAVLAVRTDAARRTGGFDASLRWGEDVDFVWRLGQGGATVRYEPGAVAWHRPRDTWGAWIEQRRRYGASASALAERHGAAAAPVRCSPWIVVAWGAALAGRPAVGASVVAAQAALLARRLRPLAGGHGAWSLQAAVRLTLRGHGLAGLRLARALTGAWWPPALVAAVASRRLRKPLAAAALAPALVEWTRGRRPAGLAANAGLRILDGMAYGAGVWEGAAARRHLGAVRPDFRPRPPGAGAGRR